MAITSFSPPLPPCEPGAPLNHLAAGRIDDGDGELHAPARVQQRARSLGARVGRGLAQLRHHFLQRVEVGFAFVGIGLERGGAHLFLRGFQVFHALRGHALTDQLQVTPGLKGHARQRGVDGVDALLDLVHLVRDARQELRHALVAGGVEVALKTLSLGGQVFAFQHVQAGHVGLDVGHLGAPLRQCAGVGLLRGGHGGDEFFLEIVQLAAGGCQRGLRLVAPVALLHR